LQLHCDEELSNFAFSFNLRRYMNGLRGAAHLHGREGTIVMRAAADPERVVVCITDGTEVTPTDVKLTRLMHRLQ
jgi:hypothetical protein